MKWIASLSLYQSTTEVVDGEERNAANGQTGTRIATMVAGSGVTSCDHRLAEYVPVDTNDFRHDLL